MKIEKITTLLNWYKNNAHEEVDNLEVDGQLITINNTDYLVFDIEEYKEVKKDSIKEYISSYGIYGFDAQYQEKILKEFVKEEFFVELIRQFYIEYIENNSIDIIKEAIDNSGCKSIKDYIQYNIDTCCNYIDFCKEKWNYNELIDILEEKNAINWSAVEKDIFYNEMYHGIESGDYIKAGEYYIMEL